MKDCIFCKLVGLVPGYIPIQALVETDHLMIIPDRSPVAKDHVLVIPKEHVSNITESSIDQMSLLVGTAAIYGKEHMPNGFRIVINTGDDAGQTVKHFHVHVIGGEKLKDL